MSDEFLRRLEAVERAVSDGQTDLTAISDAAATTERLARVEARVDDLEADLAALDGRLQAIRGYLSGVDGVSADVEQRADLALAKATKLESAVFDEADGLVVERLSGADGRPAAHRVERPDPGDADLDDANTDDSGWAAQASARLSPPTESTPLVSTDAVADGSGGSSAAPGSATRPCSDSSPDTIIEDSDSDSGAAGSLVGYLRGAFGQ